MTNNIQTALKLVVKNDVKKLFPKEFTDRKLIGKFFDYVMNNFFQKGYEKYVNGYVGKKTLNNTDEDFYLQEPTAQRQLNQLNPVIVTTYTDSDKIKDVIDYDNFLKTLKVQGALIDDQNRLMSSMYWSWAPAINLDMFLNYNCYYWVDEGPTALNIVDETNVYRDIIGQKNATITYEDEGEKKTVNLLSGMRIKITNDINKEYNDKIYIIEGVGTSIELIDDTEPYQSSDSNPDYFVMERGCKDGNLWSKRNRWFHINSISTISKSYPQAKKPIMCYNKDIELYNYGNTYIGNVDLVYYGPKNDILGRSLVKIQNVEIKDGMRILFIDKDTNENKIYEVYGQDLSGVIGLAPLALGSDEEGNPVDGETIIVTKGTDKNKSMYYSEDKERWIYGQEKLSSNQNPLFNLYDNDGIRLDNSDRYFHSSFKGSKLFDYKNNEDAEAEIDRDLNRRIVLSSYGNYIFTNNLYVDQYFYDDLNHNQILIEGFKYFKINGSNKYYNNWYEAKNNNSQYLMTEFLITDTTKTEIIKDEYGFDIEYKVFELKYLPIESETQKNFYLYNKGNIIEDTKYYIKDSKLYVSEYASIKNGDSLFVKMMVDKIEGELDSQYSFEIPLSLSSNVFNDDITEIKYNEMFSQLESIISSQKGFEGSIIGRNNYQETAKDLSLGTQILQHSSPILKTMLLNSKEFTNIRTVLTYISKEYTSFKNRFNITLKNMADNGELNNASSYIEIISMVLDKLNLGKEGLMPFFNNGILEELGECYIPSTPAYLGMDNCYEPRIIKPEESGLLQDVLLCHDGSYELLYPNGYELCNNVIFELEQMIYDNILGKFKNALPNFHKHKIIPGFFRETDYTLDEYNQLKSSLIEKYCENNNIDYTENKKYEKSNPFTWNWSNVKSKTGEELNGSYRAIYNYYFDTYKPHLEPWAMLGFGSKPEWWEEYYGSAPYTSKNYPMWKDIENGYIADGDSKGYHKEYERKGLIENYLPVDEQGNLLNPYECGIAIEKPTSLMASSPWKLGDMGGAETLWTYSSDYHYDLQTVLYLMKPTKWVEENWNSVNTEILYENTDIEQVIDTTTGYRNSVKNIHMHNELKDNGEYYRYYGFQQWVSDFITNESLNITEYLGDDLRNMDVRLGYKCAGFYNPETLKIVSDNYGIIPNRNYDIKLYESISGDILKYSSIIVKRVSNGWMIDGYDMESPYFMIKMPKYASKKTSIQVNNKNFTYYHNWEDKLVKINYKSIITTAQEVYDILNGYQKALEDKGIEFIDIDNNGEIIDFKNRGRQFLAWASLNPSIDTIILLNPCGQKLKWHHNGIVDNVAHYFNGFWTITDTFPSPIYNDKIDVYRGDSYTTIEPKENVLSAITLMTKEVENIIVLNNKTIYGDVLYDSLLGIKTFRLKINGTKTSIWDGTYFTPGYFITKDGSVSKNFDKLASDLTVVYDTDDVRSFGLYGDKAKETIGYQKTKYMENLLIDDRNMFDFYKGLLKEKGTRLSFGKINRSNYIMTNASNKVDLYENWAIKMGQFGYIKDNSVYEFRVRADDVTHDPQTISFTTKVDESKVPSIIRYDWENKDWIKKNTNYLDNHFVYKNEIKELPTGGFALLSDVDYIVSDETEFEMYSESYQIDDKIWIVKTTNGDWDIRKKINMENNEYKSLKVINEQALYTYDCNGLDEGDLIYVQRIILSNMRFPSMIKDESNLSLDMNYLNDRSAWAVFEYHKSDVISAPNGIISKTDNDTKGGYNGIIQKGLKVKLPNGKTELNSISKFKEYILSNDMNIQIDDIEIGEYNVAIDNLGMYYLTKNTQQSIKGALNYDIEENLYKYYNGYFWDGDCELYAWKNNNDVYYTLESSEPSYGYKYNESQGHVTSVSRSSITSYTPRKYFWSIMIDGEEVQVYTTLENPNVGDDIFNIDGSIRGIVTETYDGSNYIFDNDIRYERTNEYSKAKIVIRSKEYEETFDMNMDKKYFAIIGSIEISLNNQNEKIITNIDVKTPYSLLRIQPRQINVDIINKCYLVDDESDKTLAKLNIFDPLHGIIPENLYNEITYITAFDPVNYEDPNMWYDDMIGKLWWDISKVRYIDYYQSDIQYRRDNWGKQLPGSEIAIMEWTKSQIMPRDVEKYIVREVYNIETSSYDIFYYYWNKNPAGIPNNDFRTISAYDISTKINTPQEQGVIWFAPISLKEYDNVESSFIIGNFASVTASKDFVVQINNDDLNDINGHTEWMLLREEIDEVPTKLWNKMKESLIGQNSQGVMLPDNTLPERDRYGISDQIAQTMFKDKIIARKNFVDVVNDVFTSRDIISGEYDTDSQAFKEMLEKDMIEEHDKSREISYVFETHESMMLNNDETLIGKYIKVNYDEIYNGISTLWIMNGIEDYSLVDYQKYDVSKYFTYIDAYANESIKYMTPKVTCYMSEIYAYISQGLIKEGDLFKIIETTSNGEIWKLCIYNGDTTYMVVGVQNGFAQLLPLLYDYMENRNDDIFIGDETYYEYLTNETKIVIEKICGYFEAN